MPRIACVAVALLLACATAAFGQGEPSGWMGADELATVADTFRVDAGEVRVQLSRSPVTDLVSLEFDGVAWPDLASIRMTRSSGLLLLPYAVQQLTLVVVHYRYDPSWLANYSVLRELLPAVTDTTSTPVRPVGPAERPTTERTGTSGLGELRIDGSKTVSVQGGTNREATVDQGLNLSISGPLSEGIHVRAQISDDNLPITPEGNTEELRDLDQVRIELFGRRGRAVVGDFRIDEPLGAFIPYQRKLQGFDLYGVSPRGNLGMAGGAPRGSRVTTEFYGREAVQGPYEIVNGLRLDQSVIVAGSERVFVDGATMVRGADREYTIDYIRGTVTFTARRPITANSRVAVDFELSDSAYRRNVFSARADTVRLGPLRVGAGVLRDGEDPNRPKGQSLTAEEVELLRAAGDDPSNAISEGVTATAPGEGDYIELFTTGGERYFVAADTAGGDFDVNFRYVGPLAGEYTLEGATPLGILDFIYRGAGLGDYTVGRQLALPAVTDAVALHVGIGQRLDTPHFRAEINVTDHDANRFSNLDDSENVGSAWRVSLRTPALFGDPDVGNGVRLEGRAERIENRFHALGRIRTPFFYEAFNLQGSSRDVDEEFYELNTIAQYPDRKADFGWERLDREGEFLGDRLRTTGAGRIVGPLHWTHFWSRANTRRTGQTQGSRIDRRFGLSWNQFIVVPFAEYSGERFEDYQATRATGFHREGLSSGLRWVGSGELMLSREVADSLSSDGSGWLRDRETWTARGRASAKPGGATLDADLTWRQSDFVEGEDEVTRLASVRAGWRAPSAGLALDVGYRISNETSRVLSRQIVFVGIGDGRYDIDGNPVGAGQGNYDLLYTPSDSTVTSTEVRFDSQIDWRPDFDSLGGFRNLLVLSIREQSRTDDIGALLALDPSVMRNPDTTVYGEARLRNDLTLLRKIRRLDLKFAVELQELLDQRFVEGPKSSDRALLETRLEGQFTSRWSGWVQGQREERGDENSSALNPLLQGFDVLDRSGAAALRWREGTRFRVEVALRYTRREEQGEEFKQDIWSIEPSTNLNALGARWSALARIARITEASSGDPMRPYFFEAPGTARSAGLQAQWGAAGLLSINVRYQITDEPGRKLRQDMGVETRARF